METITIELNTPKAKKLIDDLVDLGIISIKTTPAASEIKLVNIAKRTPGGLLRLAHLANEKMAIPADFNDPLDDLEDYMSV